MSISFTIYGDPHPQSRPRFTRAGITYKDKKQKSFEAIAYGVIEKIMPKEPLQGPLCLKLTAVRSIPDSWSMKKRELAIDEKILPVSRPDTDNYVKAILDVCNKRIFKDDSQVVGISAWKKYGSQPRIEVTIVEYDGR